VAIWQKTQSFSGGGEAVLGGVTGSAYFVSNGNEEKTLRAPEKEKADPSPIRAQRGWAQDDNEQQRREAKTKDEGR
jgi:hypothetical protein